MEADLKVFREIIACIEAGTNSEITGWLFHELCTDLKQDAEIFVALHPENASKYLMDAKLQLYAIITRRQKQDLSQGQTEKIVLVERGLLDLYRFFVEAFFELKDKI